MTLPLRVLTLNVNGIRSAIKKGLFPWFLAQDPDVICLQETKISADLHPDPLFDLPGYHRYFFSAQKKGYSGVAIYTKRPAETVIYGLDWVAADGEGRYCCVDYPEFSIASLYLPSGTSGELRQSFKYLFLDGLSTRLKSKAHASKPYIICGDFNIAHKPIDLKHWRSNQTHSGFLPEERAWMDHWIDELGYMDAFRKINQEPDQYTWWSYRHRAWCSNAGWRIDYQFINPLFASAVKDAKIVRDLRVSDHAPVIVDYVF